MKKDELEVMDLNIEEGERMSEKNPRKKINIISWIVMFVGVICICISLYQLYGIYMEYKVGQEIYNKAEEEFVQEYVPEPETESVIETEETEVVEPTETTKPSEPTEVVVVPEPEWYERVSVNLSGLQSQYSEVVGWIYFENEAISYPVMHTTDNTKYLRMAYDGTYSKSGSIYVETSHNGDFSGMHTIVYGHNQKDKNMFGKLMNYYKHSWYYNNHKYFQIFSGDKIYRYKVFAYQVVDVNSFVFTETFGSAKELSNRLLEESMIHPGVTIEDGDKIVTLCTCTDDAVDRFLVSAVLVETYDRTTKTVSQN